MIGWSACATNAHVLALPANRDSSVDRGQSHRSRRRTVHRLLAVHRPAGGDRRPARRGRHAPEVMLLETAGDDATMRGLVFAAASGSASCRSARECRGTDEPVLSADQGPARVPPPRPGLGTRRRWRGARGSTSWRTSRLGRPARNSASERGRRPVICSMSGLIAARLPEAIWPCAGGNPDVGLPVARAPSGRAGLIASPGIVSCMVGYRGDTRRDPLGWWPPHAVRASASGQPDDDTGRSGLARGSGQRGGRDPASVRARATPRPHSPSPAGPRITPSSPEALGRRGCDPKVVAEKRLTEPGRFEVLLGHGGARGPA